MKLHKRNSALLLACVLTGALGLGSFVSTARAASDNISVGLLDESKLGEGYVKYRTEVDTLQKRAGELDAELDAREVMNAADGKRFDALINNKVRSAGEESELQTLVAAGAAQRKDRDALVGKAAKTPDEDKRLKMLQDNMAANKPTVSALEDSLFQSLKTDQEATDTKYIGIANDMVTKIAVEKKLTVVFRKGAVVWFAPAIDITDEVLARLNR